MRFRFLAAGFILALAIPVSAQQPPTQEQSPPSQQAQEDPDRPVSFEEQLVVTASRTDQQLVNAPASVSLISNEMIQNTPGTNMGDLLRAVPGINITQLTARDVNLTTRGATSTLATAGFTQAETATAFVLLRAAQGVAFALGIPEP